MGNCNSSDIISKEYYYAVRNWINEGNLELVEKSFRQLIGLYDTLSRVEKKRVNKLEVKYLRKKFINVKPEMERI